MDTEQTDQTRMILPPQSRPNYTLVKVFGVIGAFFVIMAFVSMWQNRTATPASPAPVQQAERTFFRPGQIATLEGGTLVGVTTDDYSELLKLSLANDRLGVVQMMMSGHAFLVAEPTSVRVIEIGVFKDRIRVEEGQVIGRDGWVPNKFLH